MVSQIKKWNGPDGCKNGGEKCLYAVCIRCTCCRDDISLGPTGICWLSDYDV